MSRQSITGLRNLLGRAVTREGPNMAAKKAVTAVTVSRPRLKLTFWAYCQAAILVPENEGILVVPSSVATGYCGKVKRMAGVWINPPPPTMASIKPAQSEKQQSRMRSVVITGAKLPFLRE